MVNTNQSLDLVALVSSRICHDLVSPVGAIVNGVGLVQEMPGQSCDDEIALIGQSAERASRLLQFYRIAFGEVSEDAGEILPSFIRDLAVPLISTPRINVEMIGGDGPALPRAQARMLCLLVLVARALSGRQGTIQIFTGPTSNSLFSICVEPPNPTTSDQFLPVLNTTTSNSCSIPPRGVEFLLLANAIRELNFPIKILRSAKRISIQI